jgi:hypothetical protein
MVVKGPIEEHLGWRKAVGPCRIPECKKCDVEVFFLLLSFRQKVLHIFNC